MKAHTKVKHIVLENYLKAWFPIMAFSNERIIYIDGFAGPGKYTSGEDGSPIMALKIATDIYIKFTKKLINKEFIFIFIEQDKRTFESLSAEIDTLHLPKEFKIFKIRNHFAEAMEEVISTVKKRLDPTFAFIDPFGTKGVPFELVNKIMSYKKCEVFLNFMNSGVVRSAGVTDHTDLFGTDEWTEYIDLPPQLKNDAFLELYKKQLKKVANVSFTRSFNVKNKKNSTIFDLIYATNNEFGLDKMKIAMWKADPLGNFTFCDKTDPNQTVLFEMEPDLTPLAKDLLTNFSGQKISINKIEKHVIINTPYLSTHIKMKTLHKLEKEGIISVKRSDGSTKGYTEGTIITFP